MWGRGRSKQEGGGGEANTKARSSFNPTPLSSGGGEQGAMEHLPGGTCRGPSMACLAPVGLVGAGAASQAFTQSRPPAARAPAPPPAAAPLARVNFSPGAVISTHGYVNSL